MKKKYTTLF